MPPICAASSRLAFSTVLRNILREVSSEPRLQPRSLYASRNSFLSKPCLRLTRNFDSRRSLCSSQVLRDSSSEKSAPQNSDDVLAQPQKVENTTVEANLDTSSQGSRLNGGDSGTIVAGESSPATITAGEVRTKERKNKNSKDSANDKNISKTAKSAKDSGNHKSKDTKSAKKKKPEPWQIQKEALKKKFKEGWNPPKRLSPDAIEGIRHLHATAPDQFTTPVLAEQFKVSPEAIRRILKSKWRPTPEEMEDRRRRWQRRHDRIWAQLAELGLRPKRKKTAYVSDVNTLYDRDGPKPI